MSNQFTYEDFDSEEEESLGVVDEDWLATAESTDNAQPTVVSNQRKTLAQIRPRLNNMKYLLRKFSNNYYQCSTYFPLLFDINNGRFRSYSNGDVERLGPDGGAIDIIHKSRYIVENLDLFYSLCEVDDWNFASFSDKDQEELMKTLIVEVFSPGQNIICEGDPGGDLFFVIANDELAHIAEVEVVNGNLLEGMQ